MPKASVNENDLAQLRKHQIWDSGKIAHMKPIPETHAMDEAADNHLRPGVRSSNARHLLASLLLGEVVHQADLP